MTEKRQRVLRRLSAIVIGGTLVAVIAVLGVLPLLESWQGTTDSIDRSSRLLAGYQHVIDQGQTTNARLDELRQQDGSSAGLIDGATSALAVASLQSDVKQVIESHGGKIQSMQPGTVSQSKGFERLEVKVDLSVAGDAFADLVTALDSHRPALLIDPIELHAPEGGPQPDRLTIRMTVSAYRRLATS